MLSILYFLPRGLRPRSTLCDFFFFFIIILSYLISVSLFTAFKCRVCLLHGSPFWRVGNTFARHINYPRIYHLLLTESNPLPPPLDQLILYYIIDLTNKLENKVLRTFFFFPPFFFFERGKLLSGKVKKRREWKGKERKGGEEKGSKVRNRIGV